MEVWFTEQQTEQLRWSTRAKAVVHHEQTEFQEVLVVETAAFGRLLALDGYVQITDRDEFIYHEMLAHVPATAHPGPERALVIGGGDGGVVRELLKHPTISRIDLVEIDGRVVELCRRFFPAVSCGLDDPRVTVHIEDGIDFVQRRDAEYDLILVDSSEPIGPGIGLFQGQFYAAAASALRANGLFVAQTESPFYNAAVMQRAWTGVAAAFPRRSVYLAAVPTYPSGLWSFTVGSKSVDPAVPRSAVPTPTRYYTPEVHAAAFALPPFVRQAAGGEE